jgi:alpha-beta hydrolase superfamily lysophospholipase
MRSSINIRFRSREMNPRLLSAIAAFSTAAAAAPLIAQDPLAGTWVGEWVRDGSRADVTLHITRSGRGYQGNFDSETLRVVGIPMQAIEWNPPRVGWTVGGDETTIVYVGQLGAGRIAGRFTEGQASGTFSFARSNDSPPARHEDIAFPSGEITLAGTVFTPRGKGPHPGIVFLHGSGAEGRWASNYLAEKFAQGGFVALTFDKRGVGHSGGDWRTAGFDELAGDAAAAVAALRGRVDVDPRRVGFHAHSQGATLAPLAAARIGNPAFIIASAPGGVPMGEMEIFSMENSLGVRSMSPADAAAAHEYVLALVATAYGGAPRDSLMDAWRKVRDKPWAFEPPPESDSYWAFSRKTADYDAPSHWRKVSAPTLLVFGERDERTPARESAARIAQAYLSGRGTSLEVLYFPGAGHAFRLAPPAGAAFSWPRTVGGYPQRLVDWASRTVGP